MELAGKKVIVVGLGRSGLGAVRLCCERGASVLGTDTRPAPAFGSQLDGLGAQWRLGGHQDVPFSGADLIVVSPGVPALPELVAAAEAGVEIIGELELATRFVSAPIIAIGGTNGKSTVTTLIGQLLQASGKKVFVGGNLGVPLVEAVGQSWDALVVEVSSFQLERIEVFKPRVSLLLNVTEDHLDRYPSFAAYAEAKGNAFAKQEAGDVAIIPSDDPLCLGQARRGQGRIVSFGLTGDYAVRSDQVVEEATRQTFAMAGTRLHGRHNWLNAAAAIAAVRALGVAPAEIAKALVDFVPLHHRMAFVGEVAGVRFYDDSKATNVGSALTALGGLTESKGVVIAGGRDKLGSYEPLVAVAEQRARAFVLIGEAAQRIAEALGSRVPYRHAGTMAQAVETAFELAQPGDAVLLSPACASFDMFTGYAARGDAFVAAARSLALSKGAQLP
jgi:UDP-N-acetylmuramoylalanine--D-glutamate ligase